MQTTVKHVCNCIDTRQPWFLERFWDNEFLIPQSHPDTMRKKKVLADEECAYHAGVGILIWLYS